MLFNLFGNKEEENQDQLFKDKVYINANAKINAIIKLAKEQPNTLFIAWFEDTAKAFRNEFSRQELEASRVLEAIHVQPGMLQSNTPIFLEHYPLLSKELALVENWAAQNIAVFSAMDEPLFKHFGSDKMVPLIKLLGMKEAEAIEHSYVSQSINKGQHKISEKIKQEQIAYSQAEWMELNLGSEA